MVFFFPKTSVSYVIMLDWKRAAGGKAKICRQKWPTDNSMYKTCLQALLIIVTILYGAIPYLGRLVSSPGILIYRGKTLCPQS